MAAANGALLRWPGYLTWLPRFLFDTDRVPESYIGKAWLRNLNRLVGRRAGFGQAWASSRSMRSRTVWPYSLR